MGASSFAPFGETATLHRVPRDRFGLSCRKRQRGRITMRFFFAVLLLFLFARPALADFAAAKAAFKHRDYKAAIAACKAEAKAGEAHCQNFLGFLYAEGLGVRQDPARAVHFFRLAATQGLAAAQSNLARAFELGMGVHRDPAKAALWYAKAAAQRNAEAENRLAILYAKGEGVRHNPRRAAELFHRAALAGLPEAEFNLGLAFEKGRIVRRNLVAAFTWFVIAAKPSSPPGLRHRAEEAAHRVAPRIPRKEREEAERRAEHWHPGEGDPAR